MDNRSHRSKEAEARSRSELWWSSLFLFGVRSLRPPSVSFFDWDLPLWKGTAADAETR